jgi:hypothetical protein
MRVSEAFETYLLYKAESSTPRTISTDRLCLRQFCDFLGNPPIDAIGTQDVLSLIHI